MKAYLVYMLLAVAVTVAVVFLMNIEIRLWHVALVPLGLFAVIVTVTTIDKMIFQSRKRSLTTKESIATPPTAQEFEASLSAKH
jgi:NADH:ubiquinone oxidoreductase subunit 3 (subunit A)